VFAEYESTSPLNLASLTQQILEVDSAMSLVILTSLTAKHTSTLRLGWGETVMDAIAGTFNGDMLDVIRAHDEVESWSQAS
jgi:hypothetical protein